MEEMYTMVLDKSLNLILSSYVDSGDCHNFSSTSSTGCGSSNVRSLLQETLPAVVLQGDKIRIFNYLFLVDVNILLSLIIFFPSPSLRLYKGKSFSFSRTLKHNTNTQDCKAGRVRAPARRCFNSFHSKLGKSVQNNVRREKLATSLRLKKPR